MSKFSDAFDEYQELGQYLFETDEEYKKLESLYQDSDSWYLLEKIEVYSKDKIRKFHIQYFNLILFISYYYDNHTCKSDKNIEEIIKVIKSDLEDKVKSNDLEYYSTRLRALFSINWYDEEYYINEYKKLEEKGYLYSDIIPRFVTIFIKLWNKYFFTSAFKYLNLNEHYGIWESEWIDFLISFDKKDFNKYFLDFITFFSKYENKEKLTEHYHYYWVLSNKYNSHINTSISKLLKKITTLKSQKIIDKLFSFVKSEFEYSLKNHLDIKNLSFALKTLEFLSKKDKKLYLKLLSDVDFNSWSFDYAYILSKYIRHWDEYEIFKILEKKDSLNFIVNLNDYIEKSKVRWWKKVIEKFKTYKEIKNVYKNREKAQKNDLLRIKKSIEKEKKEILEALKNIQDLRKKEWKFYYSPKLVYEFKNRQLEKNYDSNKKLNDIFTKKQYEKIKNEVLYSISNFFDSYEKLGYSWFYDNLEYNQLEWNRVSYPSIVLNGTVDMFLFTAFHLKIDLSTYTKFLIWFMPFISISKYDNIDDTDYFKYIEKNIDDKDIDYILQVYSLERDTKDDLRYCKTWNLFNFYKRFSIKFTKVQKEKFYKILESFIFNEKLLGDYYNLESLKLLKESAHKQAYFKNLFDNNYIDFNFFKDVLNNIRWLSTEELKRFKILSKVNEILIEKYQDNKAIKWRINQLKEWKIEVRNVLKVSYPQRSSHASWISEAYNEIYRFLRDEDEGFIWVLKFVNNENYNSDFLELLKLSLEILSKIDKKEISDDFQWYARYLQEAFFTFLSWFKPIDLKEIYLKEIEKILDFYDDNIKITFNTIKLKRLFWANFKEQANDLYKKWSKEIEKLIRRLFYFSQENIKLNRDNQKLQSRVSFFENNYPNITEDVIVFLEGKLDKKYLTMAYEFLSKNNSEKYNIPFFVDSWWHRGIKTIIEDYSKNSSNEKKIIWLFDFDDAFDSYNSIKNFEEKNTWNYKDGIYKKHVSKSLYIYLLPIPFSSEIKNQVLYENNNENKTIENFKENSTFWVEHLFYDVIDIYGREKYFKDIITPWWWKVKVVTNGQKESFYDYIEKNIDINRNLFDNFIPILEFIKKVSLWSL